MEQASFADRVDRGREKKRCTAYSLRRTLADTLNEHGLCFESGDDSDEILRIIDPGNPIFGMYIHIAGYGNRGRFNFGCSYQYRTTKIVSTDSLGNATWSSDTYQFTYFFNRDEILALGGKYQNYSEYFDFSRNSLIAKKEIATISDFLRVLTPYNALIAAVTPKINAKIADENSDLALLNQLRALAGNTQTKKYSRYRIHIGEYTIKPNGGSSCIVSRDMTLEEAIAEFTPSK